MKKIFANLRVGEPDVSPSAPSHVQGIRQGNHRGAAHQRGFHSTGPAPRRGISDVKATAARSTGINPHARDPIDPSSPALQPA